MNIRSLCLVALAFAALALTGCKTHQAGVIDPFSDDVDTPTNGWGLRKLDPADYPDMRSAWADKAGLERAIDKSLQFLHAPSSERFYPSDKPGDTITHEQIRQTLMDFKNKLGTSMTPEQFQQHLLADYDVYTSIGYNNKGDVWFTGYFTPIYQGSLTPTSEFKYPVYSEPADLDKMTDHLTGQVNGPYPARRELVTSGRLKGLEVCYFRKPIEPFIIQVQGSAKVILTNGQTLYLGYAGSNGHEHRGLGSELVKEGKIDKKHLSLPAVLAYFDEHPDQLDEYVMRDERFTFLKPYSVAEWPSGSLGVQVTPQRSLATDKTIFPRASMTFIDVAKPTADGNNMPYQGFVLDQDTGGAIKAPGRADIYIGIGDEAGKLAGRQFAQGRLYYLFLKPERMQQTISHPALAPAPALKNPTTARPVTPARSSTPAKSGSGGDDMFPGAVKKN